MREAPDLYLKNLVVKAHIEEQRREAALERLALRASRRSGDRGRGPQPQAAGLQLRALRVGVPRLCAWSIRALRRLLPGRS